MRRICDDVMVPEQAAETKNTFSSSEHKLLEKQREVMWWGLLTLFSQLFHLLVLQIELIGETRRRVESGVGFVQVHLSEEGRLVSTAGPAHSGFSDQPEYLKG